MTEPVLPKKPEPYMRAEVRSIPPRPPMPLYADEHITAYGKQCYEAGVAAERARCANLCETLNHGAFGAPSFLEGVRIGSIGCAAAIRGQEAK